jgi:flagellar hook assembly protein FlgD
MKHKLLISMLILFIISSVFLAEPSFNGTTPGCDGSGCHNLQSGIVTATQLSNLQVQVTVSGVNPGDDVAGELVDASNNVVDVINKTQNNPFTLTAPNNEQYTVNAGYKNPHREWGTTTINLSPTTINIPKPSTIGNTFELLPNHPNPFNNETIIKFSVPKGSRVELNIFDIHGKHIRKLTEDNYNKGIHSVRWNGHNDDGLPVASGMYLYQLTSGDQRLVRSLILSK